MNGEWRPVPGFPGYERNAIGQHRSLACAGGLRKTPRLCKPQKRRGYWTLSLRRGRSVCTVKVARAVLEYNVGPCPEGLEACHDNGDRSDDSLGNLYWGTHAQNMADRERHGTTARGPRCGPVKDADKYPRGQDSYNARLATVDVRAALQLMHAGFPPSTLSPALGVTLQRVSQIWRGKAWRHLPRPWLARAV